MSDVKNELKKSMASSLKKLIKAMGWSQNRFAEKMDVASPTISNYLNEQNDKLPDLPFLVRLIRLEEIKNKGLNLTVETLLSPSFDPESVIKKRGGSVAQTRDGIQHRDFLGTYICYFFDQTKTPQAEGFRATREFRFGVICAYDDYEGISGEAIIRVCATFYKEHEFEEVKRLKKSLDDILTINRQETSVESRNRRIRSIFAEIGSVYYGAITFGIQHVFINIQSEVINDQALIILYSPHKRIDRPYKGGLGSVCSVAHGRHHMPTAQKMILSKYELNCSNEEIAEYLSMSTAPISSNSEIQTMIELFNKLYGNGSEVSTFLDDNDKKAILTNRMNQLIRNYVERNSCCVGSVSDEDDTSIYSLIKKYGLNQPKDK